MKIADALDLWLSPQGREFARHAREGTWRTRRYLAPHLRRILGQREISRLTQDDIALVQHELQLAGMAAGSINITTHAVFFALLRDLEAIGKVRGAVSEIPMEFETEMRDGCFDDDQLFAVWSADDVTKLIARLRFALDVAASSSPRSATASAPPAPEE